MEQSTVGHIDADCFYVSAERVRYADLEGAPVGVIGNQGACVIAKSYEMKAAGVKTGEAVWEAVKKCPDGTYLKRDFRWYEILSRQMLEVVREHSPVVEYHSIDEFFFLAQPPRGMGLQAYAESLRDRIMKRVRVPATVGIGRSKTLAKLISDTAKPNGALAIVGGEAEQKYLEGIPVSEITGIAKARASRLANAGIRNCLEFAKADRVLIRRLLTCSGESLWWELNGEPVLPIYPKRIPHKVLSRGGSFGIRTADPDEIFAWLVRNLERLVEELAYHEVTTSRLVVWVGYKGGRAGEGRAKLTRGEDSFDVLLEALRPCLRQAYIPNLLAERMHVVAEELRPRTEHQLTLFGEKPEDQGDPIGDLKRAINNKHGRFKLRSGATLPLQKIYADRANSYDICDVRGKTCF